MTPKNGRAGRHRVVGVAVAAALLLSSFGLAGCGIGKVVSAVNKVRHDVSTNKATIDEFTSTMKSGEGTTFEARYVTTGKNPTTVIYAVKPPKGVAFRETPSGHGPGGDNVTLDLVVNKSGEYSCSPPSSAGSRWTCQKLGTASAAAQNQIFGFYTPSHWVAFLRDFSLAAGFAGDKIGSTHITVNGFSMNCVTFVAAGVKGTSKICTTAQGILGYVKVASNPTSFEITSYSASPSPGLFRLPAGAKITTTKTGTS
jgi:hypothetical protein